MEIFLKILLVIFSIGLVAAVLLQEGKSFCNRQGFLSE